GIGRRRLERGVVARVQRRRPRRPQRAQPLQRRRARARPADLLAWRRLAALQMRQRGAPPPVDVPAEPGDGGCGHRVGFDLGPVRPPPAVLAAVYRPHHRRGAPQEVVSVNAFELTSASPGELELPVQQASCGDRHAGQLRRARPPLATGFRRWPPEAIRFRVVTLLDFFPTTAPAEPGPTSGARLPPLPATP